MDRRGGTVLVVAASVLAGVGASAIVVALTGPTEPEYELPYLIELPDPPVIASNKRAARIPADSDFSAAPGVALERVHLNRVWEESRAELRDLTTGDVRSYAIGDLIPHGSVLVGVSTGTADLMVADVEIVRLEIDRPPQVLEDFRTADEATALKPAPELERNYRGAIEHAIATLGEMAPEAVQLNIDELIACGDPAVEILIVHVDDQTELAPGPYRVGNGGEIAPRMVGDVVIAVLESITGQTFGDPTAVANEERQELSRAWLRWWGVE